MVHYNQATDEGTIYVLVVNKASNNSGIANKMEPVGFMGNVGKDSINKELQYVHGGNIPYLAAGHAHSLGPVLEQGDGRAPDDLLDGGERVLAP